MDMTFGASVASGFPLTLPSPPRGEGRADFDSNASRPASRWRTHQAGASLTPRGRGPG